MVYRKVSVSVSLSTLSPTIISRVRLLRFASPHGDDLVCLSARSGEGTDALVKKLSEMLDRGRRHVQLQIPYAEAGLVDLLSREGAVQRLDYGEDGIVCEAVVGPELFGRVKRFIPGYKDPVEDWDES